MSSLPWKPWNKVVTLRDDIKSNELSLAEFAADIYDVAMKTPHARKVYASPKEFFALTYPTNSLRELAKDVISRLAGKSDKAIRLLELAYGGGKTHTLITLYHLVTDPDNLPDLPAVHEFKQHIAISIPKSRTCVLSFDKLDAERGMEVLAPTGERRWLKNPWSVLAFQIAGAAGLRLLSATDTEEERDVPPAENLLVNLLSLPGKENLSTLILIDEVLMYARNKVGLNPEWRGRIVDFFQYLTQAAAKVDRAAIVASLLASDPSKDDTLGRGIVKDISEVFQRQSEVSIQPVGKEDIAEVLRRRFFKPESIRDRESFRQHVIAGLQSINNLDEATRKEGPHAEERYLKSYPFHPDLTEVFYSKWVQLEVFQKTRGVLRTFAIALRDADRWDTSPLVSVNVFLNSPGATEISEAARLLANVAATEQYEGKKQIWPNILEGELAKAREIEGEITGIKHREVEQAVFATFLHSQPIGQKALLRDLMVLIGTTKPDRIELEKGLRRWTEASWFLDESAVSDADVDSAGHKQLPKSWRLGSKPNLTQMHADAALRVTPDIVEDKLISEIGALKSLTAGASAAGARVHPLPEKPNYIEDDGEFHYAVLGPRAASDSGKPSAESKRFIDETTGPDKPRVNRNAVLLVVPSREGLEVARKRIRDYFAWEEVRQELNKDKKLDEVDPIRAATLASNLQASKKKIPDAIQQAYSVVVTVAESGDVQAFKINVGNEPLFNTIKSDRRSRIQETAVSAEALLPEGPYNLWREGETSRYVKDLVGAFAQFPHLPKMLRRKEILDTLVRGVVDGVFVLRIMRPDRSTRTFWRQEPDDAALKDPSLEVVMPEAATLSDIAPVLLTPKHLPSLWPGDALELRMIYDYFSGGKVIQVPKEGYEEPVVIPKAEHQTVNEAVQAAVQSGKLWMVSGPSSVYAEPIPEGLLADNVRLLAPPQPLPASSVLPENLPAAWENGSATAQAISAALSQSVGETLPWKVVSDAITAALRARLLELGPSSSPWPCDFIGAQNVILQVPKVRGPEPPTDGGVMPPEKGVLVAAANLRSNQVQDLADQMPELAKAAVGLDLKFHVRLELDGAGSRPSDDVIERINKILKEVSDDFEIK